MKHIIEFDKFFESLNEDFDKEYIKHAFNDVKSKIDLAKKFNIPYANISGSNLNKRLKKYADIIGINLDDVFNSEKNYYKNPNYCKKCGNILPYNKRYNDFCSQSCAASYNNTGRQLSDDTKNKIRQTSLKNAGWSDDDIDMIIDTGYDTRKHFVKICPVCHKDFRGKRDQVYCSSKCQHKSDVVRKKISDKQNELVALGLHKGWSIRTKETYSYAEKYWMDVLDNHKIDYIREDHENGKYFLDFLIEKNGKWIDLEIDGKQHKEPDRVIHDKERDEYLIERDYIIYRIEWNSVNSIAGREKMEEKINKFIEFYNSI